MKSLFASEVLAHPLVLWSVAATVVIAAGSGLYYIQGSKAPVVSSSQEQVAATTTITASGIVTPAQNPDLALQSGGRVAVVTTKVGATVTRGTLLVSLDTAALSAARAQAAANLRAAQARLAELEAGPRTVDISAKQTAVAQTEQSLSNLYTQAQNDILAAYSNTLGAVHANTDTLFNNADSQPTVVFNTSDTQAANDAATKRTAVNSLFDAWQAALGAQSGDTAALEAQLNASVARLMTLRQYADTLTQAVAGAISSSAFSASSAATANTNLTLLRATINATIAQLQADTEQIASDKIAIQSAQDSLNQTLASSTPQVLEAAGAAVDAASASLDAADASLRNAVVVAPFNGTVAAVRVKVGDLVPPNTTAVSLIPQSALQVEAYLSESDAAKIVVGTEAQVTLDAYSNGRLFNATVVGIDRSPTMQNNIPAYKVTLQFVQDDPALAPGMTANISITPR